MASSKIRIPKSISVAIIIVCLLLAGFLLLFGVAHLIHPDEPSSNVSTTSSAVGTLVAVGLCGMAVALLLVAAAEIRRFPKAKDRITPTSH